MTTNAINTCALPKSTCDGHSLPRPPANFRIHLGQYPGNRLPPTTHPRNHTDEETHSLLLFRPIHPTSRLTAHLMPFRSCPLVRTPDGIGRNAMGWLHLHKAQATAEPAHAHSHTSAKCIWREFSVCVVTAWRRPVQLSYFNAALAAGTCHVCQNRRPNSTDSTCEVWGRPWSTLMLSKDMIWYFWHGCGLWMTQYMYISIRTIISCLAYWVIGMDAGHIRSAEERSIEACIVCHRYCSCVCLEGLRWMNILLRCACVCIHRCIFQKKIMDASSRP